MRHSLPRIFKLDRQAGFARAAQEYKAQEDAEFGRQFRSRVAAKLLYFKELDRIDAQILRDQQAAAQASLKAELSGARRQGKADFSADQRYRDQVLEGARGLNLEDSNRAIKAGGYKEIGQGQYQNKLGSTYRVDPIAGLEPRVCRF